jgi:hypothetical protein
MLQRRQIVIKTLDYQIDIEDPVCMKHAIASFHSIGLLISVNVTIYRTVALQRDQNSSSHCIMMTLNLRAASMHEHC